MLLRRKDGPPRTPKRSKKEKEKKRENVQKLGLTISKSMDSEKIQINKAMTPSPSRNGLKYNEEMGRNKKRKKRSPKKRSSGKRSSGKKKNERRHRRDRSYSNDDDLDEKQIVFGTIKRSRSKSGTRGRTRSSSKTKKDNNLTPKSKKKRNRAKSNGKQRKNGRNNNKKSKHLALHNNKSMDSGYDGFGYPNNVKVNRSKSMETTEDEISLNMLENKENDSEDSGFPDIMHFENIQKQNDESMVIKVTRSPPINKTKHSLNLSQTSIKNEDEELLFAEVNAEIEQRQSAHFQIERELNKLASTDFEQQFNQSLEEAKKNEHKFKQNQFVLLEEIENDIEQTTKNKGNMIRTKISRMFRNNNEEQQNQDHHAFEEEEDNGHLAYIE